MTKSVQIGKINEDMKLLQEHIQSLESKPSTQEPVNRRKEQVRGELNGSHKAWQVLKVAFTIPILGKSFVRDFSPLRSVLVSGDWDRVVVRLVPVLGAGGMVSQIAPPGALANLNRRYTNTPGKDCPVSDSL